MSLGVFPRDIWSLILAELPVAELVRVCDVNAMINDVGCVLLEKYSHDEKYEKHVKHYDCEWWGRKTAFLMRQLQYHIPESTLKIAVPSFRSLCRAGAYLEVQHQCQRLTIRLLVKKRRFEFRQNGVCPRYVNNVADVVKRANNFRQSGFAFG